MSYRNKKIPETFQNDQSTSRDNKVICLFEKQLKTILKNM